MIKNLEKNKIILIIIIVIAIIAISLLIEKNTNENIILQEKGNEIISEQKANVDENISTPDENKMEENKIVDDSDKEEEKIYVYVTGEVNNSGVVVLDKGSRIIDAINAAGGTTSKADISKINLVYIVEDGMKISIPNSEDLKSNEDFKCITSESADGSNDASDVSAKTETKTNSSKTSNMVNINTATQTELETLPGIGPSLALKIINYRKENGKFSSIEDIKNVSGIGDSKFDNIKSYITV